MSGFPILDLILGMTFVFFMLSIIASSGVEIITSLCKLRARVLEAWLFNIFDKPMVQPDGTTVTLGQAIMDHCSTTVLAKAGKSTSYIDAKNFTTALLEKLTYDPKNPDSIASDLDVLAERLKTATAADGSPLLSTELKRSMLGYISEARADFAIASLKTQSELQLFRSKVENWYDTNMDRVEGHLKKKYLRPVTFWVGVFVVLSLNADSLAITRYLYTNPDVRAKLATQAMAAASDTTLQIKLQRLTKGGDTTIVGKNIIQDIREQQLEIKREIAKLDEEVPLGWKQADLDRLSKYPQSVLPKIAGWLATILAIMLGAPFWFELLNKVTNLRGSGPKPVSSTDIQRKDNDAVNS